MFPQEMFMSTTVEFCRFYLNRFMRKLRRRTSDDKRRYSNDQSALEKAHRLYFGNKDLRYKLKRGANEFLSQIRKYSKENNLKAELRKLAIFGYL